MVARRRPSTSSTPPGWATVYCGRARYCRRVRTRSGCGSPVPATPARPTPGWYRTAWRFSAELRGQGRRGRATEVAAYRDDVGVEDPAAPVGVASAAEVGQREHERARL